MSTEPELEPLLAQVEWIHALARRIVLDEATAADVAQDALVVALERDAPAPRRWLVGVVRMLARERARRDARRRVRERLAARPEAQDVAADVVARAELERIVAGAALSLPEPNRSTLLLRYRDGLPPRVIARRLGLPVETVQSRLRRGLRQLREHLRELAPDADARHRPTHGLAFLVPLAVRARPSLTTTFAVSPAVLGAAAMKKGYAVAALLLVAAWVVVAQPWRPRPATGPVPPGSGAPEAAAAIAPEPRERPLADARRAVDPERFAVVSPTHVAGPVESGVGPGVRGHVRGSSGDPVAAARVTVSVSGRDATIERRIATTDAAGGYEVLLDPPAVVRAVEVQPGNAHTGCGPVEPGALVTGPHPLVIDLVVESGSGLEGTVVDETGEPVAGAEVRAWCSRTFFSVDLASEPDRAVIADAAGRFRLPHVGPHVCVVARTPDRVPMRGLRGEFLLRDASPVGGDGLRLVVASSHAIVGRLVDEHRRPVAGARVRVDTTIGRAAAAETLTTIDGLHSIDVVQVDTVTDGEGRFRLEGLPAGTWGVDVLHDELQPYHRRLTAGDHDVLLEARRGLVGRARVVGPDGDPVPGASVRVLESGRHERRLITDDAGCFSVGGLEPDRFSAAIVVAPGLAPGAIAPLTSAADPSGRRELRLEAARVIAGRVLDLDRRPVVGAAVHASGTRTVSLAPGNERPLLDFTDRARVRTDAEGRFELEGLHDGEFHITATAPGAPARKASVAATAGVTDLLLQLPDAPPSVTVLGTVRDASTGALVEDFRVAAVRWSHGVRRATSLAHDDARGELRLPGVPPGKFRVIVAAAGYADWTSEQLVATPGEVHLEVALHPARTLRLRVVAAPGSNLPEDLFGSFETPDGRPIDLDATPMRLAAGPGGATEVTTVAGVPVAPVVLWLRTPIVAGRSREWRAPIDAARSGPDVVDVVVDFARNR